jgi:ankyrin repeat protein
METAREELNLDQLKLFINKRTKDDGFTALHFSAFRGNIIQAKSLLKFGADPFAKNNFGINMHHVAAQGNEPAVMYFLVKEFQLSLLDKDDRGSTPLHWATYSKSEVALQYLLSWLNEEELNEPDNEGLTALHLAVKSTSSAENLRAVRALLIQGASRQA